MEGKNSSFSLQRESMERSKNTRWKAMNLEVSSSRSYYHPTLERPSNKQQQSVENMSNQPSLSARNILIQRKLMEKKRFDSADYAMNAIEASRRHEESSKHEEAVPTSSSSSLSMSPAQVGVSVFFNALEATEKSPSRVSSSQNTNNNRYGSLSGGNSYGGMKSMGNGPQSARNILLQRKMREKKHFDSADYQLAAQQTKNNTSKPMEIDAVAGPETDDATSSDATLSGSECDSPSPSGMSYASRQNQFSPAGVSTTASSEASRKSKYEGLSAANILLRRKLAEKKRFDSADYNMEAAHVEQQKKSPLYTADQTADLPLFPPPNTQVDTQVPAAPVAMDVTASASASSKYGKLSAANVLIHRKLRERKRFDSADYNMEHSNSSHSSNKPTTEQEDSVEPEQKTLPTHNPMAAMSQESRLAARNVLLQRKLAERKRFDSADYFSALDTFTK